jgi:hypothetical protein
MDKNLLIFGLVCYSCPGSQEINILIAQYKRISNAQAVCKIEPLFGLILSLSTIILSGTIGRIPSTEPLSQHSKVSYYE